MTLKDFVDNQFYITDYRCMFYVINHGYLELDNYDELIDREILYWYVGSIKGDVVTITVCII